MTARELFNETVTLAYAEVADRPDFVPFYIDNLNRVLAECFDRNNNLRRSAGKVPFTDMPKIKDMEEVIDYEPIFLNNILQYGIAAFLSREDEPARSNELYNIYQSQLLNVGFAQYVKSPVLYDLYAEKGE